MKLRVLGCGGGIGGNQRTTSFVLDHDILIDAGTGVGELSLAEMSAIDHIFISHSHLDHIACLPMMIDSVWMMRDCPITIYAIAETVEILRQHIFNWKVWPDFSEIPNAKTPAMRFQVVQSGQTIELNGRRVTPVPANHVVPAVGYHLDSGKASLIYTADTTSNDALWAVVNRIENLRYLIIESAFANHEKELAVLSKHLCPDLLATEMTKFKRQAEIYITHLKPDELELTMQEIGQCLPDRQPKMLLNNQVFEF
jgi:ribonuclease BN (tRNA processing enzyme)